MHVEMKCCIIIIILAINHIAPHILMSNQYSLTCMQKCVSNYTIIKLYSNTLILLWIVEINSFDEIQIPYFLQILAWWDSISRHCSMWQQFEGGICNLVLSISAHFELRENFHESVLCLITTQIHGTVDLKNLYCGFRGHWQTYACSTLPHKFSQYSKWAEINSTYLCLRTGPCTLFRIERQYYREREI